MDSAWAWCMAYYHACPPRPQGAGGDDGTWCYGECRGKCECLIFFRVSPRMPGPPGGRRGGWHMVLRRAQRQVLVHPSPPLPPPGPDPSRLTPLPPPVSRLPPVVPSRSPAPGAPAPALSFFVLLSCPLHGAETRPMENAEAHDAHDTILHWHPL